MDPKDIARFFNRITNRSWGADDTECVQSNGDASGLEALSDGSVERLAVSCRRDGPGDPPSAQFLDICRLKLHPNGWLWVGCSSARRGGTPVDWRSAWQPPDRALGQSLRAAAFPSVTSFAFSERGTKTKSCLWVVPLETATRVPCAEPALGIVVPWKQRLAERPWFWRQFAPHLGCLAETADNAPLWLADIRDRVECYYTTKWRVSAWHRRGGGMAIRDVFFPVGTTHDNIRAFWRVLENVPEAHRADLGLDGYRLSEVGDLLWIDRPLLESAGVGLLKRPRACSYEDVVDFVRRLHAVTPIDDSSALSVADGVTRLLAGERQALPVGEPVLGRLQDLARLVSRAVSGRPVLQHSDMVERNVLATADGVKAIDWWAATWVDYPGHDAVSFHYAGRRATRGLEDLVQELVRRLAEDAPDLQLAQSLVTVRADIDWRTATLTYLLSLLAAGLRSDRDPAERHAWATNVVTPSLDALQSTAIVHELTSSGVGDCPAKLP